MPRPALPPRRLLAPACAALAGLSILLATLPVHAQWVWRDANGRLTASDLPPPREVPEKDVLQRPSPAARAPAAAPATPAAPAAVAAAASAASAPAAAAPKAGQDAELQARRKAAEQEQGQREKAEAERVAALRSENCLRARTHLAALESGQRIARFNDKGEREVLDDKGRADEVRRARQVISSDCR